MKSLFIFLVTLLSATMVQSQQLPNLQFNNDKEFKVVQFTDTHVNVEAGKNMEVFTTIKKILEIEKPDLVVLTGDVATDGNPQKTYQAFEKVFEEAKMPWIVTLGNHDSQADLSRKEVSDFLQGLSYCLNNDKGETYGNSNFVFPVKSKENKAEALIYIMDSNAYSTLKPEVDGWGNKEVKAIGKRKEDECGPEINTGMFAAMLESKDIMGTFVGHDHNNDYIGVHHNVALAYGRVTKTKTYRKAPVEGARIIVLTEGERKFDSWIREVNGRKVYPCTWPDSFVN